MLEEPKTGLEKPTPSVEGFVKGVGQIFNKLQSNKNPHKTSVSNI
jgi:hypothetical protein